MIDLLDRALRALLVTRVAGLSHDSQVRFQPPDDAWRAALANLQVEGGPAVALNVYLVEVRQERELRSTERRRSVRNGVPVDLLAPTWMSCLYLISAWSPGAAEVVEPTVEEHGLLYRTAAALQDFGPVNPGRIYPAGSAELTPWGEHRDVDLPTDLLPVDGFDKLAEFWGTMGGQRWKPVLPLLVGLPVVWSTPIDRGRPAVTVVLQVRDRARGDAAARSSVLIGGRVLGADGDPAADGVTVTVVTAADGVELAGTTSTPGTGRYLLDLPPDVVAHPDRYRLRAHRPGAAGAEVAVDWRAAGHDIVLPG